MPTQGPAWGGVESTQRTQRDSKAFEEKLLALSLLSCRVQGNGMRVAMMVEMLGGSVGGGFVGGGLVGGGSVGGGSVGGFTIGVAVGPAMGGEGSSGRSLGCLVLVGKITMRERAAVGVRVGVLVGEMVTV